MVSSARPLPALRTKKRYRHLLVPLDGSPTAEIALADAVAVGASQQARLTLLHVAQPAFEIIDTGAEEISVDQQEDVRRAAARTYLESIRTALAETGVDAHTAVTFGEPADSIVEFAEAHDVDLVVMATHGRSGWKRRVLGSVAETVTRGAHGPVLLVRVPPTAASAETSSGHEHG
jgi:nucleotide-binding universal stress UspA family protein